MLPFTVVSGCISSKATELKTMSIIFHIIYYYCHKLLCAFDLFICFHCFPFSASRRASVPGNGGGFTTGGRRASVPGKGGGFTTGGRRASVPGNGGGFTTGGRRDSVPAN